MNSHYIYMKMIGVDEPVNIDTFGLQSGDASLLTVENDQDVGNFQTFFLQNLRTK